MTRSQLRKRGNRKESKPRARKHDKKVTLISFKEKDIKQRWMITSEGCPTCEQLKHDLKKDIKSGMIKVTDVGDDKGFEMIQALSIDATPVFIIELNDGFPVKYLIDE